jgi:hypothetical protein
METMMAKKVSASPKPEPSVADEIGALLTGTPEDTPTKEVDDDGGEEDEEDAEASESDEEDEDSKEGGEEEGEAGEDTDDTDDAVEEDEDEDAAADDEEVEEDGEEDADEEDSEDAEEDEEDEEEGEEAEEEDEEDEDVAELRARLLAAEEKLAEKEDAKDTESTVASLMEFKEDELIRPEEFLPTDDEFSEAMADRTAFNELMIKVANQSTLAAARAMMKKLPGVVNHLVSNEVSTATMVETFFTANQDLLPVRRIVGRKYTELQGAHPDKSVPELLTLTAEAVRTDLKIGKKPSDTGASGGKKGRKGKKARRARFAPGTGRAGSRGKSRAPKGIADEMAAMANA